MKDADLVRYAQLLEAAYEEYKADWCRDRGVLPEDVDEEVGIHGGQCYVCSEEFEYIEFQDAGYMKYLLSARQFADWQELVPNEPVKSKDVYFSRDELIGMMEKLVNSSSSGDRCTAASLGYGLERLVYDEAFQVRCAVAEQGAGVDVLVHDPEMAVRENLAKKGLALDILMHDSNAIVRSAVVAQNHKLDEMIKDRHALVRWNVVRQGFGLDLLSADKDKSVRMEVRDKLKSLGVSLEEWIKDNPDKCALPENRKKSLDAVISEADCVRDGQVKPDGRQQGREDKQRD